MAPSESERGQQAWQDTNSCVELLPLVGIQSHDSCANSVKCFVINACAKALSFAISNFLLVFRNSIASSLFFPTAKCNARQVETFAQVLYKPYAHLIEPFGI